MRCKVCDRRKAEKGDYLSNPASVGVCWGDFTVADCHAEAIRWRDKFREALDEIQCSYNIWTPDRLKEYTEREMERFREEEKP